MGDIYGFRSSPDVVMEDLTIAEVKIDVKHAIDKTFQMAIFSTDEDCCMIVQLQTIVIINDHSL